VDDFHDATIELIPSDAGTTLQTNRRADPLVPTTAQTVA
jgi:hypothetical protein